MKKQSLALFLILGLALGGTVAHAATRKSNVGEALKRKKSLRFDGRSVEAVGGGRYNSFTLLDEGKQGAGSKKLYSLPANFSSRMQDEIAETEYRK